MLKLKVDAWRAKLYNAIKLTREWSNYHTVIVVYSETKHAFDIILDLIVLMQQIPTLDRRSYYSMKHKLHAIKVTLRGWPVPEWSHHFHRIDLLARRSKTHPISSQTVGSTRDVVLWTLIGCHGLDVQPSEIFSRLPTDTAHRTSYEQDPANPSTESE